MRKYRIRAQQRPYIIVRPDGWEELTWEVVDEILEDFPILPNDGLNGVRVQMGADVCRIYAAKQQKKYDVPLRDGTYPDEDRQVFDFEVIREEER